MRKWLFFICFMLIFGNASASIALRMVDGAVLADQTGAEIVPFGVYEDIVPLQDGLYAAVQDGKCALMDSFGMQLSGFDFDFIIRREDLLLGSREGKWCILNSDGSARTGAVYSVIVPNGLSGAWAICGDNGDMVSDELLIIDHNGSEIQTGIFVRSIAETAGSGLIAVQPADTSSYIYCNADGRPVFESSFDTAGSFTKAAAIVTIGGKYAAVNTEGDLILPPEYDFADISADGVILAVNKTGVFIFDNLGNELFSRSGTNLSAAFVNGYILIYDGESLQVYSTDGTLIHSFGGDAAVYPGLEGDLIVSTGAWGEECVSINGSGRTYQNLRPLGYAYGAPVYAFTQFRVAKYMNNLLGEVQLSADMDTARYGIAAADGAMLLPAIYEHLEALEDDRFLVRIDNRWRMIDSNGHIYWQREMQAVSAD